MDGRPPLAILAGVRVVSFTQFLLGRSEEHTSELQSRFDLVCRLLLEKKNKFSSFNDETGRLNVDGMNRIINEGSNKLNSSRKAKVSYKFFLTIIAPPPGSTLFPYTTLFRSVDV